jgi:hypothetical protein
MRMATRQNGPQQPGGHEERAAWAPLPRRTPAHALLAAAAAPLTQPLPLSFLTCA